MSEDAKNMLVSMGFSAERAAAALQECGGSLESAANLLLSGWEGATAGNETPSQLPTAEGIEEMLECPLSQYSFDNGKSACTCIALVAAEKCLQETVGACRDAPVLNAEFLQDCILQGIEIFNTMSATNPSTEHLSAEEVLQADIFDHLKLGASGVVQGMLSANGPTSFRAVLPATQSPTQWTCALITKPPETVVCFLPPTNYRGCDARPFCLVDSHPRQHLFGAEGSYIRKHSSFEGLIQSLEELFPPTNLGPEIPELIAASECHLHCVTVSGISCSP